MVNIRLEPLEEHPTSVDDNSSQTAPEQLRVYCRLRPTTGNRSINVLADKKTLKIFLPELTHTEHSKRPKTEASYHSFAKVFDEVSTQEELFDHVARPLVEDLINGKNGLLFTYGVTGSGKTYTMVGNIGENIGIMPRCFDILFGTISGYQADKFIFTSDKKNGFDIHSRKPDSNDIEWAVSKRKDVSQYLVADENIVFAVFITFVEVYNNSVYDLLEDFYRSKPDSKFVLRKKHVRDDKTRNPYVCGATEVEVRTTQEAYKVFVAGKKRKRMAHTALNTNSSRSHSIFNIRLVRAPRDACGGDVIKDKQDAIVVSQLSLVDLAGSECIDKICPTKLSQVKDTVARSMRAEKQLIQETKYINKSLMLLRHCFEIKLRNQNKGSRDKIPQIRASILTRLLRNFFEKDGSIRMIMCINPRIQDHHQNLHVVKFAELSQRIRVQQTLINPPCLKIASGSLLQAIQEKNKRLEEEIILKNNQINELVSEVERIRKEENQQLMELRQLCSQQEKDIERLMREKNSKLEELQRLCDQLQQQNDRLISESVRGVERQNRVSSQKRKSYGEDENSAEIRKIRKPSTGCQENITVSSVLSSYRNNLMTGPTKCQELDTRDREEESNARRLFQDYDDSSLGILKDLTNTTLNVTVNPEKRISGQNNRFSEEMPIEPALEIFPVNGDSCRRLLKKNFQVILTGVSAHEPSSVSEVNSPAAIQSNVKPDDVKENIDPREGISIDDGYGSTSEFPHTRQHVEGKLGFAVIGGRFICRACGKYFISKITVLKHIKHQRDSKRYKCPVCSKEFVTKSNMKRHEMNIHKPRVDIVTRCPICDNHFAHELSLKSHIKDVHEKSSSYICAVCEKQYNYKKLLIRHISRNHPETVGKKMENAEESRCRICSKVFLDVRRLRIHYRLVHDMEKFSQDKIKFQCDICNREYRKRQYVKEHIQVVHPETMGLEQMKFQCCICGFESLNFNDLKCHVRRIHAKEFNGKFECAHCNCKFESKALLETHIINFHPKYVGRKPKKFKCRVCNYVFSRKHNLKNHRRRKVHRQGLRKCLCPIPVENYFFNGKSYQFKIISKHECPYNKKRKMKNVDFISTRDR